MDDSVSHGKNTYRGRNKIILWGRGHEVIGGAIFTSQEFIIISTLTGGEKYPLIQV